MNKMNTITQEEIDNLPPPPQEWLDDMKKENKIISSKSIMTTKEILQSHPVIILRKEISKTNIKGYSKMKKNEVIELMLKAENKEKFKHIQMAEKKQRVKTESKKEEPKKEEPKKAEPKKADEKEFSKNWLLKYNAYVKKKTDYGRIYSAGSNTGYVLVNELDSFRDPKFINEMNELIGKDQTPNIIVNANNFKTQIIKALYLDSIENRGMYKMVMKQVNKFISNVNKVRKEALKRKKKKGGK